MNLELNGLQCFECDAISKEPAGVEDNEECYDCGSENTKAVRIEDCPNEAGTTHRKTGECDDPNHHWGRGDHVIDPENE